MVKNFQNPKQKTRLVFYEQVGNGLLQVPKFYASKKLHLNLEPGQFESLSPGLVLAGELHETVNRPQKTVFNTAVDALGRNFGTTLVMPCGSGKTNTAIAIALHMGLKTAVLCHKNFLLEQWAQRLKEFVKGEFSIGTIQQDRCTTGDFVLCSIASLLSRDYPLEFRNYGLIIVDEVHHIAAPTFSRVLGKLTCRYTLGLTATPRRKDGLEDMVYFLVGEPSHVMAVEARPDVQVNIVECDARDVCEIVYKNGTIGMSAMVTQLTESEARNRLLVNVVGKMLKKRPGSLGLLLSDRVQHLSGLHRAIQEAHGDVSAIICGKLNTNHDGALEFRHPITLSTYQMFAEAVDFPGDYVILATPKSNVEQSTGRILRGHSGATPVIIDLYDPASLFVHMKRKRAAYYAHRGYTVIELGWGCLLYTSPSPRD